MTFLNNPDAVLDAIIEWHSESESAAEHSVKSIVRSIVQDANWSAAIDDDIEVSSLTGGITNILYLVHHKPSDRKVIVRVYGRGTDAFIDRSTENIVFAEMSRLGVGPTFFGRFTNGRVEGYIHAKALTCEQLGGDEIYPHIASALARFHSTCIPQLAAAAADNFFLWREIGVFFSIAEAQAESSPMSVFALMKLNTMKGELDWVKRKVDALRAEVFKRTEQLSGDKSSSIVPMEAANFQRQLGHQLAFKEVLCHNDLLAGNILITEQSTVGTSNTSLCPIHLIDYEYAAYNYLSYDLANHFIEYSGVEIDLRNRFPTKVFMRNFIRSYIKAGNYLEDTAGEDFMAGFEEVLHLMILASHIFWGTWAVVQSKNSTINFNFVKYSILRYCAYFKHKEDYYICHN